MLKLEIKSNVRKKFKQKCTNCCHDFCTLKNQPTSFYPSDDCLKKLV